MTITVIVDLEILSQQNAVKDDIYNSNHLKIGKWY